MDEEVQHKNGGVEVGLELGFPAAEAQTQDDESDEGQESRERGVDDEVDVEALERLTQGGLQEAVD